MYQKIDLDKININAEPPIEEPNRQYYYMAKCREWVREFERKNGRRPTFFTQTFGCQMNAKDSEKLIGILEQIGYVEGAGEDSDFVLYNTCTVRENANLRVYGRLGQLKKIKKQNPEMIIALCGCMMQEGAVVDKIKKSYRHVDLIFGTHNVFKLAELLKTRFETGDMVIDIWDKTDEIVEDLPSVRKYSFKAGVNIMYGCNNFCSYCIVPYVRGRERSRDPKDILREIENMAKDGVVEVMLLGQNVNSYGKTLAEPMTFAQLLQEVEKVEGIKRIRFMTSHPKDLSDDLIAVMKNSKKICRHLHLPIQTGSSRLLQDMNRRYTKEQYLNLVEKLRVAMPDLSLTTDIIVGYPGETEADHKETMDVVERVEYDSAFTFIYSKRTGTPAAARTDQVPEDIVKERFDRLLTLVQDVAAKRTAIHEGEVMEALVEEVNAQQAGYVTGRLSNNILVHFPGDETMIGNFYQVKLSECRGFYYYGECLGQI